MLQLSLAGYAGGRTARRRQQIGEKVQKRGAETEVERNKGVGRHCDTIKGKKGFRHVKRDQRGGKDTQEPNLILSIQGGTRKERRGSSTGEGIAIVVISGCVKKRTQGRSQNASAMPGKKKRELRKWYRSQKKKKKHTKKNNETKTNRSRGTYLG